MSKTKRGPQSIKSSNLCICVYIILSFFYPFKMPSKPPSPSLWNLKDAVDCNTFSTLFLRKKKRGNTKKQNKGKKLLKQGEKKLRRRLPSKYVFKSIKISFFVIFYLFSLHLYNSSSIHLFISPLSSYPPFPFSVFLVAPPKPIFEFSLSGILLKSFSSSSFKKHEL